MEGDFRRSLRTDLLAIPCKRRRTKKYVPPRYIPGVVDSGVRPSAIRGKAKENWRLSELAKMVDYKASEKLTYVARSTENNAKISEKEKKKLKKNTKEMKKEATKNK